ncbi:CPBP family intramembrane glutamic endopeptidase [Catenuloplanes atrovinosus]|uniref:Membrane protease YdiL (CAAX protease family) n=1 Tax=Catenuloplanes atrovinosus TaxID=137266 RepID=A0AAE3YWA9_9ACTN|nr:CPBP family intramembrane glutamic endopeptidase [Catenuloplanes atrovinosus]MDR7279917.1 membrane protease YdiL (CAAX protease family) [Catenuloplanes atrovinosus]
MTAPLTAPDDLAHRDRTIKAELLIVFGLSLGQSAVFSLVNIVARLTASTPLSAQTSTLNPAASDRPYLDLTLQLLRIVFALMPVALALHLLARERAASLGLDFRRPLFDLGSGAALAAGIGIPGLGLYLVARELGLNTTVVASALNDTWWTVPVLILAAAKNAILEEVLVVGYLMRRLEHLRWRIPAIILTSSVLRGSYHLYQGFGGFIGNIVMGVVFSLFYLRVKRVMPLIVAHTLLDIVAFVGYALLAPHVSWI